MPSALESSLPPELWGAIISNLSRSDLAKLCRTSSAIQHKLRVRLYREVALDDRHTATLDLLLSNTNLASSVVSYAFKNTSEDPMLLGKITDVAMAMPNLRKLRLDMGSGEFFVDSNKEDEFVKHFNDREHPLQEFEYVTHSLRSPDTVFCLARLTRLKWEDSVPDDVAEEEMGSNFEDAVADCMPFIWDILRASRNTLENISLDFLDSESTRETKFWGMTFPRLRVLSMGKADIELVEWQSETAAFLGRHPLIEELRLPEGHEIPPDSAGVLTTASLPRLKYFRGDIHTLAQMARYQLECLRTTLHNVELIACWGDNLTNTQTSLDVLLHHNMPKPLLPASEVFTLDISHCKIRSAAEYIEVTQRLAALCGDSLHTWQVKEPGGIYLPASVMGPIYAGLKNLREIRMLTSCLDRGNAVPGQIVDGDEPDNDEMQDQQSKGSTREAAELYVRRLAAQCSRLERVIMKDSHKSPSSLEFRILARGQGQSVDEIRLHVLTPPDDGRDA